MVSAIAGAAAAQGAGAAKGASSFSQASSALGSVGGGKSAQGRALVGRSNLGQVARVDITEEPQFRSRALKNAKNFFGSTN